jgi:hypothetical protein
MLSQGAIEGNIYLYKHQSTKAGVVKATVNVKSCNKLRLATEYIFFRNWRSLIGNYSLDSPPSAKITCSGESIGGSIIARAQCK